MSLVRWNQWDRPFRSPSLVDSFFTDVMGSPLSEFSFQGPQVDIRETDNEIIVRAEVPGIRKEDLSVTIHSGVLTLEGEKRADQRKEDERYYHAERRFGRFSRSFQLPVDVKADRTEAAYKDGVLTVTVPKAETAKPRKIEVTMN